MKPTNRKRIAVMWLVVFLLLTGIFGAALCYWPYWFALPALLCLIKSMMLAIEVSVEFDWHWPDWAP